MGLYDRTDGGLGGEGEELDEVSGRGWEDKAVG